jgi:CRISPR-associated protein Cmr6
MDKPTTTNASFIYYRHGDFGKYLNDKDIKEILGLTDNSLDTAKICGTLYLNYFSVPNAVSFSLKTTYPGLIIGSGYNHPAVEDIKGKKDEENPDFQLGFYFDHTTGMPVIPGSTVKGILKAVFPKPKEDEDKAKDEAIKKEKINYLNGLFEKEIKTDVRINHKNWELIFEKGNFFYDAYISGIPSDGKIFAEDYITPHHPEDKKMGIFKNPIPLRFLKIAPGVSFTFQFRLKDTVFKNTDSGEQTLTAEQKEKLFKKIILDFGIGAKRNVGYGNLTDSV